MRAEAIGMRLQRGQQLASILLGEGDQAGGERERRRFGAARAKAGLGHAAAEQVACATAAQEGVEPGVEQAHGTSSNVRAGRGRNTNGMDGTDQAWRIASTAGDHGCMCRRWLPPMHSGFIASRSG
jgi:hypothetical protein